MKRVQLLILLVRKGAIGRKIKITLRELAGELGTSPQSVLRLIEEMEEEGGLVEREVVGRKTCVEVSPRGGAGLPGEPLRCHLGGTLQRRDPRGGGNIGNRGGGGGVLR